MVRREVTYVFIHDDNIFPYLRIFVNYTIPSEKNHELFVRNHHFYTLVVLLKKLKKKEEGKEDGIHIFRFKFILLSNTGSST